MNLASCLLRGMRADINGFNNAHHFFLLLCMHVHVLKNWVVSWESVQRILSKEMDLHQSFVFLLAMHLVCKADS